MSAVRLRLPEEWATGRGHALEVRVDDDFPARAAHDGTPLPVELYLGSGFRSFTADEAEQLGEALIAAAREGRSHVQKSAAVAGGGRS